MLQQIAARLSAGLARMRAFIAARLVGLRTLLVAACLVILDVLSATDIMPVVPEAWRPWWMVAQPIVFMALRFVTTGPVRGRRDA
jgi:hypothetical protein